MRNVVETFHMEMIAMSSISHGNEHDDKMSHLEVTTYLDDELSTMTIKSMKAESATTYSTGATLKRHIDVRQHCRAFIVSWKMEFINNLLYRFTNKIRNSYH